ncbi:MULTISPECIES: sulfatase [unclassified Synechococcus]|uniref:sulfatase family protein n=1 Tax=unclassified Synechococcus TaxID=2626047 RepID=UPI001CF8A867|nr:MULTISPECIES: sulfatase [unclassified Synechococcus]MCB4412496.1 sulfatase [Synechococcus sp. MU1611]
MLKQRLQSIKQRLTNRRPHNVIIIFADQLRGTTDINQCHTPTLDYLKSQGINFPNAISGCSQCSPYRGSLLTGLYPLQHGVLVNDATLTPTHNSIATAFKRNGYHTAYIGKWHVHGSPTGGFDRRNSPIPRQYRAGFDHWQGNECNHNYNQSPFFLNDDTKQKFWKGYDAIAQSRCAAKLIKKFAQNAQPFFLTVSWGPPHDPYHSAPQEYQDLYDKSNINIPKNVPSEHHKKARNQLHGYYSHISALDDCLKIILRSLKKSNLEDKTIVVFTSDHGDMIFSHGLTRKLFPFEESVRVPLIIRDPTNKHRAGQQCNAPIDAPDLMPTLLGLANLKQEDHLQGQDWSMIIRGQKPGNSSDAGLLSAPVQAGPLQLYGVQAYRGVRTSRHTYVRNASGAWLLFDNFDDPFQMNNLIKNKTAKGIKDDLEQLLRTKLNKLNDNFESSDEIIAKHRLQQHVARTGLGAQIPWSYPWKTGDED